MAEHTYRILIALALLASSPAYADVPCASLDGALITGVKSEADCFKAGGYYGAHLTISGAVTIPTEATVTIAVTPSCDKGWSLVLDLGGQPMCAHELKKPH